MAKKVTWLTRDAATPLPYHCLVTTEAEFNSVMRYLKIKHPPRWQGGGHAATHSFDKPDGSLCCVVALDATKGRELGQVLALLVHEAVHIWQNYCEYIRESSPSSEFEAYTVQRIAQSLFYAYCHKTMAIKR